MNCALSFGIGEISNIAVAVGTLILAVVAIYGDWAKSKLMPPKASLELRSSQGDPTFFSPGGNGNEVMFYHVKVVNLRTWLPITNCRVWLKALQKRAADGSYKQIPMSVPLELAWAPAEARERFVTIVTERILDLGHVSLRYGEFRPSALSISNNFKGFVKPGESVRFGLWIDASNYNSENLVYFEVSWDGTFSHDPAAFEQHLVVKRV